MLIAILDFEFSDMNFSEILDLNYDKVFESTEKTSDDSSRRRTPVWVEKGAMEVVSYPDRNVLTPPDYSTSIGEIQRYKKINKRLNTCSRIQEVEKPLIRCHSREGTYENRSKWKRSQINLKNISYCFIKNYKKRVAPSYFGNYGIHMKRKIKERRNLQSTSSKPVMTFINYRHVLLLTLTNRKLTDTGKNN